MRDVGLGDKVYSPDLQTFELEGPTGIFGTVASILVGPIRLVMRVTHNVFILPANLMRSYAEGLLVVSTLMFLVGLFDFICFKKWPLVVSQLPLMIIAWKLRVSASKAVIRSAKKNQVEIDTEQVANLCNEIYDEIEEAIGKDE